MTILKPGLTNFEKEVPLFENKMDLRYTVKAEEGLTMCHDVFVQRNTIELDDDGVGFIDETKEFDYLNPLYSSKIFHKPYGYDSYNIEHPDMLYYWNFIMIHEGTLSQRMRYQLLDILEEVGGLYSALSSLVIILFSVYNYKLHESIVYQEFLKTKGLL